MTPYLKQEVVYPLSEAGGVTPCLEDPHRLGGLQGAGGERVPAAAALGAEVRRGGGRVVDVGQDVVVPPLLLGAVHVVAIARRAVWGGEGRRERGTVIHSLKNKPD